MLIGFAIRTPSCGGKGTGFEDAVQYFRECAGGGVAAIDDQGARSTPVHLRRTRFEAGKLFDDGA